MSQIVSKARGLRGRVSLPADKSIAHRAAILSALADGTSEIIGYPTSNDPQSTLQCLRQLGVSIESEDGSTFVHGRGLYGLQAPVDPLDCGNSGTTMRLLAGVLAGQQFDSTMIGDESLSRRPMGRIADPLALMGADLVLTDGRPPVRVRGRYPLKTIRYVLPVASAQVKSCILLAGLYADGETSVVERLPSRDHTERMLQLDTFNDGTERVISVRGGHQIPAQTWRVPCDFSAAAFFLVAGSIVPDSEIEIPDVGLNPTRTGLLDVLRAMGARIDVKNERSFGGEMIGDLTVRSAELHGVRVDGELIPRLIDEVPILAVAAACARGRTEIREAAELRVKETDRIDVMSRNLRAMGAHVEEFEDGLAI
ncbi:MAG TPA: 3-phosphoshikimate 1-carboxyvinyltransferase, partial [Rhodothermales bacterium]